MHDPLFGNQDALAYSDLVRYSALLHLDGKRFEKELLDGVDMPRVRRDFPSGVRSGVNGTPTFFINGVRHDAPWELAALLAAVEAAAAAPADFRRRGRP